jgi:hypothetical protein
MIAALADDTALAPRTMLLKTAKLRIDFMKHSLMRGRLDAGGTGQVRT